MSRSDKLYYLTVFAVLLYGLVNYILFQDPEFFFNADLLYLPVLYQDFFFTHYSPAGWSFTPAPYFFWDMPLFFLLQRTAEVFFQRPDAGMLLYGPVQILLFSAIVMRAAGKDAAFLFLAVTGLYFFITDLTSTLTMPSMHVTVFAGSALCVHLTFQSKVHRFLYVLIALFVVSDRLFLAWYTIPVCLLLFRSRNYKKIVKITAASVAGLVLFAVVKNVFAVEKPGRIPVQDSVQALFSSLAGLELGGLVVIAAAFISWLYLAVVSYKKSIPDGITSWLVVSAVTVFFAVLLSGSYIDLYSTRYWTGFYLLLPVFAVLVLKEKGALAKGRIRFITAVLSAAVLLFSFRFAKSDRHALEPYVPPSLHCAKKHGLNNLNVMADYWHAREITFFSSSKLRAYQTDYLTLTASGTAVNRNWYTEFDRHENKWAVYSANLNLNAITEKYGQAEKIVNCTNGHSYYILQNSREAAEIFLHKYF